MNAAKRNMPRAAVMAAAAMMLLLASCQGRTTENMVPSGQTVEVVVEQPDTVNADASDNISTQTDSIQNEN